MVCAGYFDRGFFYRVSIFSREEKKKERERRERQTDRQKRMYFRWENARWFERKALSRTSIHRTSGNNLKKFGQPANFLGYVKTGEKCLLSRVQALVKSCGNHLLAISSAKDSITSICVPIDEVRYVILDAFSRDVLEKFLKWWVSRLILYRVSLLKLWNVRETDDVKVDTNARKSSSGIIYTCGDW